MTPAERAGRQSRAGGPPGSNEIGRAAAAALEAEHAARQSGISTAEARRKAAQLIRCMDSRDRQAAEALTARLRGSDLDAVTGQVWQIEAERAYALSLARWRVQHAAALPRRLALLREVIALLAAALASPAGRPSPALRPAGEDGALLAELIAVLAGAMGYPAPETRGDRRAA